MNYQEPLKISGVDFNKIVYPKTKNGSTKKLILIKYADKSKFKNFVFQTPTVLNLFKPELNGNYADIEIGLVGKEENKVNKFKKFLNDLELKVKSDAQYHAASWFNLENDNQSINFQKIIRSSETFSEGIIKLKIIKNNDFETILQLNNNKKIGIDAIPEDSWCKMILECYGVWINTNNDFGIFFRPILISFTPKEKDTYNYQFLEDSNSEDSVDIPDTDLNQNIFMKIDSKSPNKSKQYNDSTSQLDYHELIKELESEDKKTTEITLNILHPEDPPDVFKRNDDILDINLDNKYFSDYETGSETDSETDSDTESKLESKSRNKKYQSPNLDAETSDD